MNVSHLRRLLKKQRVGNFRPLKPGEQVEAADIVVYDTWVECPNDSQLDKPCGEKETIIRLSFLDPRL